jgi:hypothetical protein
MTLTMTINDHLVELGVLVNNQDKAIQRVGATLVEEYFASSAKEQSDEVIVNVLYYLTDIQVRDYAMGILSKYDTKGTLDALNLLLDKAPTDTEFINAPACLLATFLYERGDSASAALTLSNAQPFYSLKVLLRRVMAAGMASTMFGVMREELHHKVVAGIFGTTPEAGDPADAGIDGA